MWTCLARLLVQKSSVQKKRPCLSTNQIEKVCWLVFSGQRKKYVQQTNTYRKDTRLIWIYLIWIFLNFFIYHKAFTGFNILFRKCQVGSEYSIWWKIISTYLVHLPTYFKFKHIILFVHEYEKSSQFSLSLLLSQNKSRVHLWLNPHIYILQLCYGSVVVKCKKKFTFQSVKFFCFIKKINQQIFTF